MTAGMYAQTLQTADVIDFHRSDQRQRFLALYPNRQRSITKPHGCKDWTTLSRHYVLTDDQILKAITATTPDIWGCRWGELTHFAVLDVDAGSQYHNILGLTRLAQALACVGLTSPRMYQSSESGGWHIYLFFDTWVDSRSLQEALKGWLSSRGFVIRPGHLEVFPSNNGLRLPLQPGFAWLDDKGELKTKREELTTDAAVSRFMQDMDDSAHNWELVESLISTQIQAIYQAQKDNAQEQDDQHDDGFSGFFNRAAMLPEVYDKGRKYWQTGLTATGQRHEAILCLGHYLWYGDEAAGVQALPGQLRAEQRRQIITQWLHNNHNGYCEAINRDDWEVVEEDIRRACFWDSKTPIARDYEPYPMTERMIERLGQLKTLTIDDLRQANDKREQEARRKIQQAVEHCQSTGEQISRKTLQRLTGCSPNTLRKHGDLWRLLAAGSGEYSSGVSVLYSLDGPNVLKEKKESDQVFVVESEPSGGNVVDFSSVCSGVVEALTFFASGDVVCSSSVPSQGFVRTGDRRVYGGETLLFDRSNRGPP